MFNLYGSNLRVHIIMRKNACMHIIMRELHTSLINQTTPTTVFILFLDKRAEGGSGQLPILFWIHVPKSWSTNQIAVNQLTPSLWSI